MLGNMIGGMPYKSARDGLFGQDPMANSLGSAINRPQEMMAQPMQQPKQNDFLSTVSPLGSLLLGQNPEGRNLPALLQMVGGLGNKNTANGSIAGLMGMLGNQGANGMGLPGRGATWLNELFTGGQGANNAGFRQTSDGMPMGFYVRK